MTSSFGKEFVHHELEVGALELVYGGRKLKSGRVSPYFFNTGLFNTGAALWNLSHAYAAVIVNSDIKYDVLFGPAYKGIPLATAVAMNLYDQFGINAGWAYNRKEEKDHGEGGIIVGASMKDKNVCIIDDVITTAGTAQKAIQFVCNTGGRVSAYVVAFDRQEREEEWGRSAAQTIKEQFDVPVFSIATLADLIAVLHEEEALNDQYKEILPKILAYRDQYGVS